MNRALLRLAAEGPPAGSTPSGPAVRVLLDPEGTARRAAAHVVRTAAEAAPLLLGAVAIAGAVGVGAAVLVARRRAEAASGGRVVKILAPPEVDASGGEALWRHLHDILSHGRRRWRADGPHVSFEYRWAFTGLTVSVWVPACVPEGMVERAVEAAWPGATTTTTPATPIPARRSRAGLLRLAAPGWHPLRTDFDADPLRPLLAAAAVASEHESAVVQVLARPAPHRATSACRRAARDLRLGRHPTRLLRVLDLVTPGSTQQRPVLDPSVAPEIRAIVAKSESPLWTASVRYSVSAAGGDAEALARRARSVSACFAMFSGRNRLVPRRARRAERAPEARVLGRADLVSTPELAALAHLPYDRIVPSLERAGARAVAPPPGIVSVESAGKVLGDSQGGAERPVVLRPQDARYHVHVMGATGSGKSTLLTRLILDDFEKGRGAVVIDPKGDLVADVLARIPEDDRDGRVTVLDPQQAEGRPTINMLEKPADGTGNDLLVDHLVGIFSRIFEHHWGPRLEDVLRSACLTLLEGEGSTLADVPRVLSTPGAWKKHLENRKEDELHGFWAWYDALPEGQRAQVVGPLLYKLRAFLLRPFVRDVVVSPKSTLDMGKVLNEGDLLLARLPKGLLGEDTARLLGSFVVAKSWQAATARSAVAEKDRPDASLYVDECQNFLTLPRSFDEILAEARGYHLSLVLAHQHLGQLPRDLRDSVSANARNKVFFSMSPEDAFVLARQTSPRLTEHDLSNLGAYQAAVRLVVDGDDQPAFTLRTRPVKDPVAAK